jgi:beta-glucuronidase
MERLFQKSVKRNSICLNGQWNVTYDPDNKGESLGYPEGKALSDDPVYIPSCWNFDLNRYDYMGCTWYSRRFITAEQKNSRLIFHAVSGEAIVYLDGNKLGSHYGSYNKFWFDIPNLKAGEHQLVVKVDNTINDKDTLPLSYVDWFVYGGIYRGVELEQFDDISIDHIQIDTEWDKFEVSKVKARILIKNWSNKKIVDKMVLSVDDGQAWEQEAKILSGKTSTVVFDLKGFSPELWDTENANLFMFHVSCGTDDLYERTGFRKIETQGTKILLNGKEIFIKGVNRHNDNPELGYAINGPLILRDMQIIKDLGCNAVRGSHYPNDPIVLDYCDQMGLLFWDEVAFWNHPAESLANPLLEERSRQMMREMILQDYNHPSIIVWSIQNESKSSSQEGLELFTKLASDIRSMDKSRLVSFASACGREDICFDLVDIVCWNMYPGWYDDQPMEGLEQRFIESLNGHRKWLTENGQNKPFMVTEFGAGAVPGEKSFDSGRRWTENYQEELLEKIINALVKSGDVQGFYIWQFCDCRTALTTNISLGRPRTFNNKGLVDEHRNPKLAYYTTKRMLNDIPTYK